MQITIVTLLWFSSNACKWHPSHNKINMWSTNMHFNANLMHLVTCHVVNNLISSVVLGIDWLMEHQPEIDWLNYTVTLHLANGKWLLIPGLAAGNSKPTFVFCSSKVACKLVAKGEHAWLILVSPDNSAACLHGAKYAQANHLSVHG